MVVELAQPAEVEELLPFAADSAVRRMHGEGVLLLGGGRALLLQIAHPAVAAGVANHSNYHSERWRRLLRTLRPMHEIVFGTREQALAAANGINRIHHRVKGPGYDARDPALLLWVLATLIDTSLVMRERFVGPLSAEEAAAYYADMCKLGLLLDVPANDLPPDLAAFREYFDTTLASLEVSDAARGIARELLKLTPGSWPAIAPLRLLTAGLLPEPLRERFGLGWGPKREKTLRALEACSRTLVPRLPRRLRRPPWFLMPSRP
jgi:uncharacterized protein (DUF2236 family)